MIICLIGGVGSGKTLSAVREIVSSENFPITNFRLKSNVNYHRLKFTDLMNLDKKGIITGVNWKFWEDVRTRYKNFSIYLDEAHNLIHARASMTKRNQHMSKWISQIRKVLSDSPTNHIYIITQTPRKIDINFRELTHIVIACQKYDIGGKVWIKQRFYEGFDGYDSGVTSVKKIFLGNPYFKNYDSYDMVRFDDAEKYV